MNKPVTSADLVTPKVTTGALPASRKIHSQPEAAPDLRVPLREIALDASSGEPPLPVYDTTGPYTDPDVTIDVEKGLSRTRIAWVNERGGVEEYVGREVKSVDNGNVSGKHMARSFPDVPKPWRALDGKPVTQSQLEALIELVPQDQRPAMTGDPDELLRFYGFIMRMAEFAEKEKLG